MHRATPSNSSFRAFVAGGGRASVGSADDMKQMQESAANFMAGESRKGIESPQNYGFTSVVADATKDAMGKITACAEMAVSFMGGNRSFPVGGNMDDRRHRLTGLDKGDIALFRQAADYLQMHFTKDGGFWSAAKDKTVRMALIDKNSGEQQQQQPGGPQAQTMDAGGGGAGAGGQQQQKGQKSVKKDNQDSKMFVHVTKDEAAMSGTNVRQYGADGNGYHEVNKDGNVYTGGLKGKGQYALVVTLKGPTKNVMGKIG